MNDDLKNREKESNRSNQDVVVSYMDTNEIWQQNR